MMDVIPLVVLMFGHGVYVEGVSDHQYHGFYQSNYKFTPDNETDHLQVMEELNQNVRRMLGALEHQTSVQMSKLSLEAITLGQNVLHSAELRYSKYAHPEKYVQYMNSNDFERFIELRKDTRYCLEKIDYIFQKLPGVLMK